MTSTSAPTIQLVAEASCDAHPAARRVVGTLLAVALASAHGAVAAAGWDYPSLAALFVCGIGLAEVAIAAAWLAGGRHHLALRALLWWLAVMLAARSLERVAGHDVARWAGQLSVFSLAVAAPLWIQRLVRAGRRHPAPTLPSLTRWVPKTIGQWLGLMSLWAGGLSLGRIAVVPTDLSQWGCGVGLGGVALLALVASGRPTFSSAVGTCGLLAPGLGFALGHCDTPDTAAAVGVIAAVEGAAVYALACLLAPPSRVEPDR